MIVLDEFSNNGFVFIEKYIFNEEFSSYVFRYKGFIVIVDDNFDKSVYASTFSYDKYCQMQNRYMKDNRVLRFNFDENSTINDILELVNLNVLEIDVSNSIGNHDKIHFDNTPAEKEFEDIFTEAYGVDALYYLQKEVQVSISETKTASIDYLVDTKGGSISFEANGISYHHPLIVGKKQYNDQLYRQNILVLFGIKVFRFSTNNLHYKEQVIESIESILPKKDEFILPALIKRDREIKLYEHQETILKELDEDRKNGKTTALIVLPTGSGKSQICLEDLKKDYIKKTCHNVLIMTPTTRIRSDWGERVKDLRQNYNIDVLCYNSAFTQRLSHSQDYYDYIIFDEAHHAAATNCKKTIQYYNPKYLIGLTASPKKEIEEVFGSYDLNMSLKDSINKGVVCDVACFRVKSNLNLRNIRFNGKDYNYGDLEKNVIVDSRNILIADTLVKYFDPKIKFWQGIVFCVNKEHTIRMAKVLNEKGIKAAAVYGGNSKNEEIFLDYKNKKIQFLCSCQLISEGWDSPQTEIIVMARPTLSKCLYIQQLGRGLRHYEGKKCLYLLDVVDNYAAKLNPYSFHSLMGINTYIPFAGVKNTYDYIEILGLSEHELKMEYVDIFNFEEYYKDYLSLEEAARYLYIGTETFRKWNQKENYAKVYLPIGNKKVPYFSFEDLDEIRIKKGLKVHNNDTILDDFTTFIDENQLTFSFKLVFLLAMFKLVNEEGDVNLDKLTEEYRNFYLNRIANNLPVDKKNCIYTKEYLNDFIKIKRNMLDNPFEKYERKRFLYLSKDLNIVSFNNALWQKLTKDIINNIVNKELNFLKDYYEGLGGLGNGQDQFLL